MNGPLQQKITAIVARAPDWMRQDLLSKDSVIRLRAEETLGAMIASALSDAEQD
ncbi:hypothetical protein QH494_24875 [Sphingomonas sp. AR_OL41]|uniref:hypothetical protein n=1 Tax=Sphingomonas sp. AR_OL41 TaxID=3042729 RepID=UPI00247FB51C|nr:hypothetical protein [Sphingomonas sp. AR_OL41]MDH7975434.1 hypothetical protein [Sphingomonas sp. AR_OL41]